VSVWPPRTLRAGIGTLHVFHDEVRLPDGSSLYTRRSRTFSLFSWRVSASTRIVFFGDAPGQKLNMFNFFPDKASDDHVYSLTSSLFLHGHCWIVTDLSSGMIRDLIRECVEGGLLVKISDEYFTRECGRPLVSVLLQCHAFKLCSHLRYKCDIISLTRNRDCYG